MYIYMYIYISLLVGGLEHLDYFFIYWVSNFQIIPTDELIFLRGVAQPPTRLSLLYLSIMIIIFAIIILSNIGCLMKDRF